LSCTRPSTIPSRYKSSLLESSPFRYKLGPTLDTGRLRTDTDEFCVHGREIYWLRRKKQGGVGFSNVPLEETLDRSFTVRGAKTVKRMALR
jgi:hypothetical protein